MDKLKIVDAHIHWWDLEENVYPWLDCSGTQVRDEKEVNRLARNYLPEHYMRDTENYSIQGVVHIEAGYDPRDPIGETLWLNKQVPGFPFAIIGAANLASENVESILLQHKEKKVRGIRHMLNYMAEQPQFCWANQDYLSNSRWVKNFALLEKYDLLFELMCFGHQMKTFASIAKQYPTVDIVLEHSGMPSLESSQFEQWKQGVEELSTCENVSCKLGGLGTMIPDWNSKIAFDVFDWLLKCFGPRRIMFSSNFPTDSQFCSFDYLMENVESWANSRLSVSERQDFFINNAMRVYQI